MRTAAALAAAACVAVLVVDSGRRLRVLFPGLPGRLLRGQPVSASDLLGLARRPLLAAPTVGFLGGVLAGPVAAGVAAIAAALAARSLARSRDARKAAAMVEAAGRSIAGLAAELRAGRSPIEALDAVAGAAPPTVASPLLAAARAARLGADPAAALAEHAGGVPAMAQLAACWRVASTTGAGLAEVADALAGDLRGGQRRRAELAVEVAASRASAKLLAGLPLVGIALGASLGAQPLHFLLETPVGAGVLVLGLLFEVAGLLWTDRLIGGVTQRP